MISRRALDEFKTIWREQFGEDISYEKAAEEGVNLLTLMNAVYRPVKRNWINESEKKPESNTPPLH